MLNNRYNFLIFVAISSFLLSSCGRGDSYEIVASDSHSASIDSGDSLEHIIVRDSEELNDVVVFFEEDVQLEMTSFLKEKNHFLIITRGLKVTRVDRYKNMIYISSAHSQEQRVYITYVIGSSDFAYKFTAPREVNGVAP